VISHVAKHRAVENAEWGTQELGADPHSPIAESMHGDGAKAGASPVALMRDPVFAKLGQ
jgi:hypothetical protein